MMKLLIIYLTVPVMILNLRTSDTRGTQNIVNNIETINKSKTMKDQDYTITLLVDKTPEEVFAAVNNVRGWWSEQIEGRTDKLNEEFTYHYKDVHRCKIRITEFVPGKKVEWLVLDNYFDFTKDKTEWKGTKVRFEITKKDGKTQLVFTHIGLVPVYECYNICSDAWGNYVGNSLKSLIETGKGQPNPYIPAVKKAETLKAENKS